MHKELYQRVYDDYMRSGDELSGAYFDFDVSELKTPITRSELLKTYAKLQHVLNGDDVVKVDDIIIEADGTTVTGGKIESLDAYECDDLVTGNVEEMLRSMTDIQVYRFIKLECDEDGEILSGELLDLVW